MNPQEVPSVKWEQGNVIECYAFSHNVMCHECFAPIVAGEMFHVRLARPSHVQCPKVRHLRVVP